MNQNHQLQATHKSASPFDFSFWLRALRFEPRLSRSVRAHVSHVEREPEKTYVEAIIAFEQGELSFVPHIETIETLVPHRNHPYEMIVELRTSFSRAWQLNRDMRKKTVFQTRRTRCESQGVVSRVPD